ncbi:uncharacterized protein LOC130763883 [Actinidia eriantha]|uniref:uncharacterized protein LOC130763883 n=1 Tax=Actinidia eriantha TaxID=165200 RepID=UPI002583B80A|nr:uncharacterized protein LOC130763883 [Actinidia eriantha]
MKITILSWNMRGLNDPDKRKVIKGLLKRWNCNVVCLQETKLKEVDRTIIASLWGGRWVKWEVLRAEGSAGEILMMWNSSVVSCLDSIQGVNSISCQFKNVEEGYIWAFTRVYGPHNRRDRLRVWEELSGSRAIWGSPWVCGGDFNVVRYPHEREGSSKISGAMRDFSDYIMEEELMDLPLEGDQFTKSNGTVSSKLDRFLVSPEGEGDHLDVRLFCLPRVVSDHKPVILAGGSMIRGPAPLRFENMWL